MAKDKQKKEVPSEAPAEADTTEKTSEEESADSTVTDEAVDKNAEYEAKIRAEQDKYLRLAAEYDNFRKRSIKERDALRDDIRCAAIAELLPVYDNLERALSAECSDEAFYKGVEMTMTQLKGIFESMGVTPIEAEGQPFDPNLHNAVMHIEDEAYGSQVVVQEFQKGFRLGDKVIRHSMVQVAN